MKTPSVSDRPIDGGARSPGMLARIVRAGFRARLSRFRHGALTVEEGAEKGFYGDAASGLRATLTIHDPRFYKSVAIGASIGAAESFALGFWTCDDLVSLIRIFARNLTAFSARERRAARALRPFKRLAHRLRANTTRGSKANIIAHYDLGNDFYRLFLDETMTYSCGVFEREDSTLAEASVEKIDRICRKLGLTQKDHVLEIGTGWGSFAVHAASRYGCRVTTTTISEEQYRYAVQRVEREGLNERVTVLERDYRDLDGTFDKIVSIEMIEAVGHEYIPAFVSACDRLLASDGSMAIQAITMAEPYYEQYRRSVDFIQHYIFPGACLLSLRHFTGSLAKTKMRLVHLEDITPHYARTLSNWRRRFLERSADVKALGFSDNFMRLWEYYLAYCEAGFLERRIGDVQMVLAKPGAHMETVASKGALS